MTIDAVCFDLDDTLYSYEQYARAGLKNAADTLEKRTGKALHTELVELYFDEDHRKGTFDTLLSRHGLSHDLSESLVDAFHSATEPLSPYPETEPLLSTLEERYQLGLITDGRGGHQKVDRLGIREYFDDILVTHEINRSKHEPVVFETVLNTLEVRPRSSIYVGDDPRVDFYVPNKLGMYTVRVRRGRYTELTPKNPESRPDHRIHSLNAILHVIETIT